MVDRLLAYTALNLSPRIGPIRVRRFLERFGSVEAVFAAASRDLLSVEGINAETAGFLRNGEALKKAEEELDNAYQQGLIVLDQEDLRYPPLLKEIYDPPLILYIKGMIPEKWRPGIAMVGSRNISSYGQEMARKFGYQLAYAGLPVVSGLARGIDSAAHQGALAAKGTTWAVLGCSLDQVYPPENEELASSITEKGALISEFPLNTKPDRQTFPMRNRIVSGLSFGVLVVEAGLESGALITARQALDQGRQVFAIPGRIDTPHAKGSNRLIRDGAKLVEEVSDILQELEGLFPSNEFKPQGQLPLDLTSDEKAIFAALGEDESPIDAIIGKSGLPSSTVSSTLLRLEMKKLVRQLPGKSFVRIV